MPHTRTHEHTHARHFVWLCKGYVQEVTFTHKLQPFVQFWVMFSNAKSYSVKYQDPDTHRLKKREKRTERLLEHFRRMHVVESTSWRMFLNSLRKLTSPFPARWRRSVGFWMLLQFHPDVLMLEAPPQVLQSHPVSLKLQLQAHAVQMCPITPQACRRGKYTPRQYKTLHTFMHIQYVLYTDTVHVIRGGMVTLCCDESLNKIRVSGDNSWEWPDLSCVSSPSPPMNTWILLGLIPQLIL